MREFRTLALDCAETFRRIFLHSQSASDFICRGCVVFEPIIPLDRDLAGRHIENYIPEPAAIVLVTKRNQGFKQFLQMRGVVVDGLILGIGIPVAIEAFHFFGRSVAPVSIEMGGYEGDADLCEFVAFGKQRRFRSRRRGP